MRFRKSSVSAVVVSIIFLGVMVAPAFSWSDVDWHPFGTGTDGQVCALTVYNGQLIAGGLFQTVDGVAARGIARWDGNIWQPLGGGSGGPQALLVYNGDLIAGGTAFGIIGASNIARWDGSSWHAMSGGINDIVTTLTIYNGQLIAGGNFVKIDYNGNTANRIAMWDGAHWYALGSGLNGYVRTLAVYNGWLYAGGDFTTAGGVPANHIARWNGSTWGPVGGGLNDGVGAMIVYNDLLIVGGTFTQAGGSYIAAWDGSGWVPFGSFGNGSSSSPYSFAVYNGQLIAGGVLWFRPDGTHDIIARWDGSKWLPVNSSAGGSGTNALLEYNGWLVLGGGFGGVTGNNISSWNGCSEGGRVHWTGTADTAWHNPSNWSEGQIPGAGDEAIIDPADSNMPHFTSASTTSTGIKFLSVGYGTSSSTFYMDDGTLLCHCGIGGSINGTGGTVTGVMNEGTIIIDGNDPVYGSKICNGGNFLWPAGNGVTGTFTQNGGLLDIGCMDIPSGNTSTEGIFNLNGGTLNIRSPYAVNPDAAHGSLFIGENRTRTAAKNGVLNIAGGTMILEGDYTALINRYVDVNHVIVPYPADSGSSYHKYIVRDFDNRNVGKTTVTAVKYPIAQAWKPEPFDANSKAEISPTLRWLAGQGATGHDVYFGTSVTPPKVSSNQPGTTYNPGTLVRGTTYYWRVDELPGPVTGAVWSFKVAGQATNGITGNVDAEPNATVVLSWKAGDSSAMHNVFYGTDSSSLPEISHMQDSNTITVTRQIGVTYYWRVDEVYPVSLKSMPKEIRIASSGETAVTGETWGVTAIDSLTIEDFESFPSTYNLTTWYRNSNCGVQAILTLALGLEEEHSGNKGLKIAYNVNNCCQTVYRDFLGSPGSVNWTEAGTGGAQALSIWLRGQSNCQAPDKLYVQLLDCYDQLSNRIYHPNPSTLYQSESWTEWNVSLAELAAAPGFKLGCITMLLIGIEDDTGSLRAGNLYIDDVKLYPARCVPSTGPAGDLNGNCLIDFEDIKLMADDWLDSDANTMPNGILNNFQLDGTDGWVTGKFGNALKFDGVNDWVDIDDLAVGQLRGKTIAFWFKTNGKPIASECLFGTSDSWRANIYVTPGTTMYLSARCGSSLATPDEFGNTTISDNTWYHVALVLNVPNSQDYVTSDLYVNGVYKSSGIALTASHYWNYVKGICIGASNNGQQQNAKVTIDDFRIYETALSPSNIALLADSSTGTNPGVTPLIKYNFDESGTTKSAVQSGSKGRVYHQVGYMMTDALNASEAELSTKEPKAADDAGSRFVNVKDYATLAKHWLSLTGNWP